MSAEEGLGSKPGFRGRRSSSIAEVQGRGKSGIYLLLGGGGSFGLGGAPWRGCLYEVGESLPDTHCESTVVAGGVNGSLFGREMADLMMESIARR